MKRILIIKPSSMGDVLHAFPAVHSLLRTETDFAVDWVIHPAFAELLDFLPGIQRKILFRRRELGRAATFFPAFFELWRALRVEHYDAVIDLQGLMRSALVGRLARSGGVYGPAFAGETPARWFYTRQLRIPATIRHAVEKNCALIQAFRGSGGISSEYRLPPVEKYAAAAEKLLAEHGLPPERLFLALAPGARWETKQWPPSFFAGVMRLLAERRNNVRFVLLGSPAEKELSRTVLARLDGAVPVADLTGLTSMGTLVEVIRRASVLLCGDSGPMHAAAATGTPVAALFGPTDPGLTGPYGRNCRVVRPELDCLGCFRKHCELGKCQESVPPEKMAEAVLELLKKGEEGS